MPSESHHIDAELDEYLDDELAPASRQAFLGHVAECGRCRASVLDAEGLQRTLAALPVPEPSAAFFEHALAAAARRRPRRAWIGWAAGLAAAVALVLVVASLDRSVPQTPAMRGLPAVTLTLNERHTVHLVFAAADALEGASLEVDLPAGVELAAYPGLEHVRWNTALKPGKNVLPLTLIASGGRGGELVATLHHDGMAKTFRVSIEVMAG